MDRELHVRLSDVSSLISRKTPGVTATSTVTNNKNNKLSMTWPIFVLILLSSWLLHCSQAGHEVLVPYSKPNMWTFAPEDILILQFDSRELKNYWNTSAYWNNAYANTFGHAYQYMSMSGDCHNGGIELSASWCKVKAMLEVSKTQKQKVVIFLDSDAIITTNHSMSAVLEYVSSFTGWNVSEHPVAFNQDGPGYACRHALKIGYNVCLNSGTVIWVKSKLSTTILAQWWNYAKKIGTTLFEKDWRKKWPWEQAPQYEVFKVNYKHIHLLSYPHLAYLPWSNDASPTLQYPDDAVEPYCFSHWPGAGCFLTHFCASRKQKQRLLMEFADHPFLPLQQPVKIEYLELG